jgi:hypothetical protein
LAKHVGNIIDSKFLPVPGEVSVVGIPGDSLPVQEPKGQKLQPYTLWGEIAFQIGGAELYREVEKDARSAAAPGSNYFEPLDGIAGTRGLSSVRPIAPADLGTGHQGDRAIPSWAVGRVLSSQAHRSWKRRGTFSRGILSAIRIS